jgi:hypothetical protein
VPRPPCDYTGVERRLPATGEGRAHDRLGPESGRWLPFAGRSWKGHLPEAEGCFRVRDWQMCTLSWRRPLGWQGCQEYQGCQEDRGVAANQGNNGGMGCEHDRARADRRSYVR